MNPTPEEIEKFTVKDDYFTRAATVTVTWPKWLGNQLKRKKLIYDIPAGFQLDMYVSYLHPECDLQVSDDADGIVIEVYYEETLIETQEGAYW